jgi:2-hydroxy-3-keto-5-methylthiopentenyl-1-phosphate phosphatase
MLARHAHITDLSAAAHADLLFCKQMKNGASDLMTYCIRQGIKHVPFTDL